MASENVTAKSWQSFVAGHEKASGNADAAGISNRAFVLHMRNLLRAPTLDVDVVAHCNLNCASCCHFAPAAPPSFMDPDELDADLAKLARIEGADTFFEAICLMGGEPLLHPQLAQIIRLVHARLPKAQVRVVTNGKLLASMPSGFWDAMAETGADLLMTAYPIDVDYDALLRLAQAHGVDASVGGGVTNTDEGASFFLRTPLDETGSQDAHASFIGCPLAGSTMQLLDGRIYPCNRGALLGILNERFGTEFSHVEQDYLELDSIASAQEIDEFRRTARPMCRYCASALSERIAWGPSKVDRYEWLMRPDEYGNAGQELR